VFTDLRLTSADVLGELNHGFAYLTANLAQERLSIAANSQAAAQAALEWTVADLGEDATQHAKFEVAACHADVLAGQALVDAAALELVAGQLDPADAATAKLYCTEMQNRVVSRCLAVMGPGAYSSQARLGNAYLDARVSRIFGGSSEIMKVIISQSLLSRTASRTSVPA
jgi:acyl-CoA dehydrogenase